MPLSFPRAVLLVCLLALAGCSYATTRQKVVDWFSPPSRAVPGEKRESWCYRTLGKVDCFPAPQSQYPAESLVSVDPPWRYPPTREAYVKELAKAQQAQ